MKVGYLRFLFLTSNPCGQLFVSSFFQGAHSNTATRRGYYSSDTLQRAQSLVTPSRDHDLSHNSYSQSSTSLNVFFRRFSRDNENNNDDENDDENNNDDENQPSPDEEFTSETLERARLSFEAMFTMPKDNIGSDVNNVDSYYSSALDSTGTFLTKTKNIAAIAETIAPPPLTAISRDRRLKEITLLSTLSHSDDAVNELWALWIAEKGPAAATLLLRAEHLMSIESYEEAEALLWSLIHQYGVHWAEPVNRLATLKYMQGNLEESKELCETVLRVKPWHFGALSGIVLVCTATHDATGARVWADRRLPPFVPDNTSGSRRMQWISRALDDAKESLHKASRVGRDRKIGKQEAEFRQFRAQIQNMNMQAGKSDNTSSTFPEDHDAWQ
mmetsp:Transcript_6352/g.7116  ORF Transcript_6352/g.7116 Transcript_6352/m.7116 type:complete len:387 (+) Transcript_6352:317-1477(+)